MRERAALRQFKTFVTQKILSRNEAVGHFQGRSAHQVNSLHREIRGSLAHCKSREEVLAVCVGQGATPSFLSSVQTSWLNR
ncbi:hypothetical protein HQ571_01365 [Candidatus Kuenenbacteria bacterium]|nr:hypothetical protein [Candidatus Kuenenbacteria bacterium]